MASFVVLLAIVAHRFLRLDLLSGSVAALRPPVVLTGLLGLALLWDLLRGHLRLRPHALLGVQWSLCAWAALCKVVADGAGAMRVFLASNYLKDVLFLSLVGVLTTSLSRLRRLLWLFVAVMAFVAVVVIPQRDGPRRCYYYDFGRSAGLNYSQRTDGRGCVAAADCYEVPPGEEHLRGMSWACEHEGPLGLATVLGRARYVGSMEEPNAMSLALVMACAMALGLATWPGGRRPGSRGFLRLLLLLASALSVIAVVHAASRAGQAAMGLTLLCFFALRVSPLGALAAAPLLLPLALLSSRNAAEAAYSTAMRARTMLNGYQAFLDHPIFGVGPDNYGRISSLNAHNSFLLAATETGVVGSGLFVLGVYLALKLLLLVWRRPPPPDEEGAGGDGFERFEEADRPEDLRHLSATLTAMLVGVCSCIAFESLSFDVMWLFPAGVIAAFYRVVQEQLPDFELRVHAGEIVAAFLVGGLLPSVIVFATTAMLY